MTSPDAADGRSRSWPPTDRPGYRHAGSFGRSGRCTARCAGSAAGGSACGGRSPARGAWWLNLQAHPDATVELAGATRPVVAHAAEGAERDRLWATWRLVDEQLDGYAARRPGETAVVVLAPRPGDSR
ncbi:nitroreductase/quinone reductase family protein [Jiangella endophytica]|uniref:nitroreductase/quinone reductase family protein n=1 Tax=Jiangella endophytica TaxID=1623398 RepID=UPI0018E51D29